MSATTLYADIVIPLPLPRLFTYSVPSSLQNECVQGVRVAVQFGKRHIYTGIVWQTHDQKPTGYETKPIQWIVDNQPVISALNRSFWQWIADYYLCSLGDVLKAALPSGLRIESETNIHLNPDFDNYDILTAAEQQIMELLNKHETLTINELVQHTNRKNVMPLVKSLAEKGAVSADEAVKENYRPRVEKYIALTTQYQNNEALSTLLDTIKRAPQQQKLLMAYIELSHFTTPKHYQPLLKQTDLLQYCQVAASVVKTLVEKGVFTVENIKIDRLSEPTIVTRAPEQLSEHQHQAWQQIQQLFEQKDVVLLHGVTASGKTEIYIHLIAEQLAAGKQVLYLLPEIALTTQIINRLKAFFGNSVGVYHSKFNDSERVEIWQNILKSSKSEIIEHPVNQYKIILGVRSSLFLPFHNLGLVIIDEEHETTYKQYDPAPRYHARDAAIVLASMHKAKTLLGTATPAIESYYNATTGKYGLVELTQRYGDVQMPEIVVADIRAARKRRQMQQHFTPQLMAAVTEALQRGEQVILFQNRRGFAPYIECNACGWVAVCDHCDVSLTYHKHGNKLVCHYCGFGYPQPGACMACGDTAIQTKGFGTEKIEDDIALMFPQHTVGRLDLDTTRTRKAYQNIIADFETKKTDILVGTQMITKGLDFDNVSVVGVLNADDMLNFPDFRAFERSFQLMAQVSGRAGRRSQRGRVIVQTGMATHNVIGQVVRNDYKTLYLQQIDERQRFRYPPFYRLVRLTVKHRLQEVTDSTADQLAELLRKYFGQLVLGPEYPLVSRVQNRYLKNVMLKTDRRQSVAHAKKIMMQCIDILPLAASDVQIVIDVDPF